MVLMRGDSISPFELEFIGTLSLDVLLRICERKDSSLIGSAISIDNDFMAVSALSDYPGSVFAYRRTQDGSWRQEAKLRGTDPAIEEFGCDIVIKDSTIVVSDIWVNNNGADFFYHINSISTDWEHT